MEGRRAQQQAKKEPPPTSLSLSPSFLIRCRHICRAMTNSRALPALAMRAAHNNCSAQQKAEIPIQSLELILRTARRKLGSVDIGCNGDRRSTDRLQFFTLHRPLHLFPSSLPPFALKTNNERDQSLTAETGRDLGRRAGGRGRHGKRSNAFSSSFNYCLRSERNSRIPFTHRPRCVRSCSRWAGQNVFAPVHGR